MSDNKLLSEEECIRKEINDSKINLQKLRDQIEEAKKQKAVGDYIGLVQEAKDLVVSIELLEGKLVSKCHHIRIVWREVINGKTTLHIACAADCGYKEDSKDYKNAGLDNKLPRSIIPYIFSSREEAIKIYEQAIQLVPSGNYEAIERTMLALVKVPMLEPKGKQRVAHKPVLRHIPLA